LPASSLDLWEVIADEAVAESPLWAEALLPAEDRDLVPVFSPLLAEERYAVGVETIYEGYLLHYGRPRLFEWKCLCTETLKHCARPRQKGSEPN